MATTLRAGRGTSRFEAVIFIFGDARGLPVVLTHFCENEDAAACRDHSMGHIAFTTRRKRDQ